jgi:hypothetical protein
VLIPLPLTADVVELEKVPVAWDIIRAKALFEIVVWLPLGAGLIDGA